MNSILQSLWCLPCVWSAIGLVGVLGVSRYFMDVWVPAKGPLPSDGPAEGFPSRSAMKAFYDTSSMRVRAAAKAAVIVAGVWLVGLVTLFLILKGR
jgi:hypothetical protein